MIKYFDINFAIKSHDAIIDEIGGLKGYNKQNIGYLISALDQIQNDDLYPNLSDKMAHLIFSCVKFHPFLDGNKRSAIYLAERFARLNGFNFDESFFEIMENVVLDIAKNQTTKDELKTLLIKKFL